MLAGKYQVVLGSLEIKIRVAERVDIAGAAQSLTSGNSVRSVLARVMHQHNRKAKLTLQ